MYYVGRETMYLFISACRRVAFDHHQPPALSRPLLSFSQHLLHIQANLGSGKEDSCVRLA